MIRRCKMLVLVGVTASVMAGFWALAGANGGGRSGRGPRALFAELEGFQEVPAVSTTGSGKFRGRVARDENSIEFELSYDGLEGTPTAAHIHIGQPGVNGGVSAFLCGGGGRGACPPPPATVRGTIFPEDIIGPTGQGVAQGEFGEVLKAIREGVAYVNVHSDKFPGGEIRGQIE